MYSMESYKGNVYRKNKIQKKFIRKSLLAKMLKNLPKSPRLTVLNERIAKVIN